MALTEAVRRAGVTPRLSLLVGPRHAWNGTVVQVYPQGTWYTPCWKLDATCRQLHETERWNGEPGSGSSRRRLLSCGVGGAAMACLP